MNVEQKAALKALNKVIRKSRTHFYKPIQIAEILYRVRTGTDIELSNLEEYRNISKKWRDAASQRLIGRICTSSQKFQDNIFDANAMPPEALVHLSELNIETNGSIEEYVYSQLKEKYGHLDIIRNYIRDADAETFELLDFILLFTANQGLKRSVDKAYEIVVYALFATLVRAMKAEVSISLNNPDEQLKADFADFLNKILALSAPDYAIKYPAKLFRVGVTNAADRGLDMWSNFGPAIQVKHLNLNPDLVEDIVEQITADKIVIVALDNEKDAIEALLMQVGWSDRIQSIVSISDLNSWYAQCFTEKYKKELGNSLIEDLYKQFSLEFPSLDTVDDFFQERGYTIRADV